MEKASYITENFIANGPQHRVELAFSLRRYTGLVVFSKIYLCYASAAKLRAAGLSFLVRLGWASNTSSTLAPAANLSGINAALIRTPLPQRLVTKHLKPLGRWLGKWRVLYHPQANHLVAAVDPKVSASSAAPSVFAIA